MSHRLDAVTGTHRDVELAAALAEAQAHVAALRSEVTHALQREADLRRQLDAALADVARYRAAAEEFA